MTWGKFFKSRAFKYSSATGLIGFGIGAGISAIFSLKIANQCSVAIDAFMAQIEGNFTIPKLTADIEIWGHDSTVTLKNINAVLPDDVLKLFDTLDKFSEYCYTIPFTIGLCLTVAIALALANTVATTFYLTDQPEESTISKPLLT